MFLKWLKKLWKKIQKWYKKYYDPPSSATNFIGEFEMSNIRLTWDHPTTRESGLPLDPADIAETQISMSADGGANWSPIGMAGGLDAEFLITDVEPATYNFRAITIDTKGDPSQPVDTEVSVLDQSAPSSPTNFIGTVE